MAGNFNPAMAEGFNWRIEEKKNTFAVLQSKAWFL
jgi:hypothetical protein